MVFLIRGFSYENLVNYFYQPTDPSSLGVIRGVFGFLMLMDLPEERGGADVDLRWGDSQDCHFPLFPFLHQLPFHYMALLYGLMALGATGMMLGLKFQLSTFLFGVPYWYILLLDKSYWNNHSYLYGIVTILFMGSSANHYWSIDGLLDKKINNTSIPYWNYFILKYQFFMLYFLAGLKKTDMEWLDGYSMSTLGTHWVFQPFTMFLTPDQIEYLIVHWFGFLLDLTIGFWMLLEQTRPLALIFCACFHLMNSRLFSIGMFPYVCLATLPLFCEENWPRKLQAWLTKSKPTTHQTPNSEAKISWKHKLVVGLLLSHCSLQAFLPYSHFITKGYNNWTNGLYGYSWDMMIHSWNTVLVVVKVVDHDDHTEKYLDHELFSPTDRWNKHADMCLQYAQCLEKNLHPKKNISIYIDVWCSLNGRFQQRMYDPNYDLLQANWSPLQPVEWLLPVLTEYNDFRQKMLEITEDVYSWSNSSDVLFIADYPGLMLENFISTDLDNVTLTVLEGQVVYELVENGLKDQSMGLKLMRGDDVPVEAGVFHKIHTVGSAPSCYMYTFNKRGDDEDGVVVKRKMYSPFPMVEDVQHKVNSFGLMFGHVKSAIMYLLFDQPIVKRFSSLVSERAIFLVSSLVRKNFNFFTCERKSSFLHL